MMAGTPSLETVERSSSRRFREEIQIMFDNLLTPSHLIIVLVIALLIFGPRKLPELGKGLGEGFRGFKDGLKGGETPKAETPATKTEVTEVK
jgi:sec-independent protein translocase protein TatA